MKRPLLICFVIFALCFGFKNASATSYTWTGAIDTHWNNSFNWFPFNVPALSDDVFIPNTTNKPTVNVASSCNSVTITGNSTLTLSFALTVTNGLTVNGGATLITAGTSSATFGAASSVGNPSTLNIGSGSTLTFNAALSINAGGALVNNGNLNSTSVTGISSGNPGTITNSSTGTITLTGSQLNVGGGSNITNSGIIIAKALTVTPFTQSTISSGNPVTFKNNLGASITLTGSTLNFGGGTTITNDGAITANAASAIIGNNPAPIPNTGSISLSASTLTLNGGSNITNSGTVSALSGSTITMSNPSFINNTTSTSSFTLSASTLNVQAGASITNSGTITTGSTSTVLLNGNPASITNNVGATFTASSTTFTMVAGSTITNTGGNFTMNSCSLNASGNPTSIINQNSLVTTGTTGLFTLNTTSFTFTGTNSLINYGLLTANVGSSINITSASTSSSITNYGTFYAGTSGSLCTITLNGTSPSLNNTTTTGLNGFFFLGPASIIYPTSTNCTLTNNTGCASCTFTLQSDATGSAAIAAITSGASVSGTYNVERFFQGGSGKTAGRYTYRNYRIISSPVHNNVPYLGNNVSGLNYIVGSTAGQTTAASSLTNAFITGAAGGSTSAGNPTLYLYNEAIVPSNVTFTSGNFIGITDITNSSSAGTITTSAGGPYSVPIGTGVFFFFRGAATNWSTRTASPYIAVDNVTLTSVGQLNQGALTTKDWYLPGTPNLSYTVTGVGTGSNTNTAVRGFNMVGNPYPCSIDWNTAFSGTGITRTNINPTIYVFNPVTNQYDSYITTSTSTGVSNGGGTDGAGFATNIIASGQGFFVRANSTSAALTFTEAAKAPTSQVTGSNLLMGTPAGQNVVQQLLRLKMVTDSLNYDNIAIAFNSAASANYNENEDAMYLPGLGALEGLSSLSADGTKLAINFLPLPKLAPQIIKLDVEATASGNYSFQQTALTAIPQIYDIWLMDKFKKDSLDIRANPTYAFTVNKADTTTFGNNRFSLVIRQNPAYAMHLLAFNGTIVSSESQIVWKTEFEQNYTNFTVERSTDKGATFTALGGFQSTAASTYSFMDKSPVKGTDQYRLKLVDLNGTVTYSNIITLEYSNLSNSMANNLSLYPNPATGVINLSINQGANAVNWSSTDLSALQTINLTPSLNTSSSSGNSGLSYDIKIISITGTVVKTATSTQPTWQGNVSNLPPGTYIIQVTNSADKSVVGKNTFIKL